MANSVVVFGCPTCKSSVTCRESVLSGGSDGVPPVRCNCTSPAVAMVIDRARTDPPPAPKPANPAGLVLLVDGNNYLHTFWAASGASFRLTAAQGLVDCLNAFKNHYKAIRVIVVFDGPGKTFRHMAYPEYKANREPRDPGLDDQIQLAKELLPQAGFYVVEVPGYEADDVLATLTDRSVKKGNRVVVFSRDKDMRQLLDGQNVTLLIRSTRNSGAYSFEFHSRADFEKINNFHPVKFVDYLALSGDPSDGWPGVQGIGDKTARELLGIFGGLDEIVAAAVADDERIAARNRDKLKSFNVNLARTMVTLRRDVPIPVPGSKNEQAK